MMITLKVIQLPHLTTQIFYNLRAQVLAHILTAIQNRFHLQLQVIKVLPKYFIYPRLICENQTRRFVQFLSEVLESLPFTVRKGSSDPDQYIHDTQY